MTGDPKVLGPLQQAFNTSDVYHVRRYIGMAWEKETDTQHIVLPPLDERIRAWTPPPAEPSLDDLAFGLSIKFAELSVEMDEMKKRLDALEQHPEPTAPADPVCARDGCWHKSKWHCDDGSCGVRGCDCEQFIVKPTTTAPADLDPVRVEAAAKAALESRVNLKWSEVSEMTRKTYMWDAEIAITAYLKDGGAS